MSAITIGGDLVHYEVLGRGRPVVLIHGWIGAWQYWVPLMQQIHLKYRVYALDLFGFGDSAKNQRRYTLDEQVKLLDEFMKQMGLPKAAFVGHGLGAMILIEFASRRPASVHRMMAVSAPLFDPGDLDSRSPAGIRRQLHAPKIGQEETVANRSTQSTLSPHEQETVARMGANERQQFLARLEERNNNDTISTAAPAQVRSSGKNPLQNLFRNNSLDGLLGKCFKRNETSYDKLKVHVDKTDSDALSMSSRNFDAGAMLDRLRLVEAPAVVVHGDSDLVIPNPGDAIWEYLTVQNDHKLVAIPLEGVRHFPMLEHEPFSRLVNDFLSLPEVTQIEVKERWRRRSR